MAKIALAALLLSASVPAGASDTIQNIGGELIKGSGQHGVFRADLKLTNPNDFAVKDARLLCAAYGRSGTDIATFRPTVYRVIPAKGSLVVKGLEIGIWPNQAVSAACVGWIAQRN